MDTQIGHYTILSAVGKGGMGEVWRARDTKLGREVAIKTLPEEFAKDADRLARFEREARMLAALNHPHIAAIHGLEQANGMQFLVLEFVEGETLADRIARGPISVDESVKLALQIAEALEAAHEKGIVHRDLKPANLKVTSAGTVKVLDFGLAKAFAGDSDVSLSNSPTLSVAATQQGYILGTAAYMSPEQAKGRPADRRADIWAFGVVLYEMITGRPLFTGDSVSEVLAAVIKEEPKLDAIPAELRPLLKRCLHRDPRQRLQAIGEARIMLENPAQVAEAARPVKAASNRIAWIVATLAIAGAAALSYVHFVEPPPNPRTVRFQVPAPREASTIFTFRLSPDARYLAFVALGAGRSQLWVRPVDSLEPRALPGTEGLQGGGNQVFWSPDSAFIGFVADGKLKKVSVAGGPPQSLCDVPNTARATWGREGVILVAPGAASPILRVPSAGGVLVPVTKPGPGENHFTPEFLPDGRHFLYFVLGGKTESTGIYAGSLDGMPPVRLLPDLTPPAEYVTSAVTGQGGHLLFRRENTLMVQPFDPKELRRTGEIFPLAEPVAQFAASENGALAYVSGASAARQELVWVDRAGKQLEPAGPPGEYDFFRLAPDEKRIAFNRAEGTNPADIWVLDMTRGVPTRITFDSAMDNFPIWSPDGLRILWPSNRTGAFDLYVKAATGTGSDELLIQMGTANGWGTDWSRDGKFILYQKPGDKGRRDLWIAPQSAGKAEKPFPYLQSEFDKQNGVFSPDGRWIAYVSNESGRDEVFVQAFPLTSEKVRISIGGGSDPAWRKDGTELFYLAADRNLMVVPVRASGAALEAGTPKALFSIPGNRPLRTYAPSGDGRRFLITKPVGETSAVPVTVVLNWQADLKR